MEATQTIWLRDHANRRIRLTEERWNHLVEHPEMVGQLRKLRVTLRSPGLILMSRLDPTVHLYFRPYQRTPVGRKHLMAAVKIGEADVFVLTAFFTDEPTGGTQVWPR